MVKKLKEVILIAMMMLFALTLPVFAREMTVDELGEEAVKYSPQASYVYVIGEYAFTSTHDLTTQDVMLAAKTIKTDTSDGETDQTNIYKKMAIQKITPKKEIQNGNVTITGWNKDGDILKGGTTLDDKINIRYIDYNYVKDIFTVEFDLGDGKFADEKTSIKVVEGEKINEADITGDNRPTKEGKQFKEWVYTVDGEEKPWDFDTPVTSNMKLKATWYKEVNTDTLLEKAAETINNGTKEHGYYYDVDFENGILTFNVYDLNIKNSEISGTGLIADIVNIVNTENVVSITISNGKAGEDIVFDADDVTGGTGSDSAAWQQFGILLAKLTGKEFNQITLGDLVAIEDKLTLTITLDENNARSQKDEVSEDYLIEFSYTAPATVAVPGESEDFTDFNYTSQDTYQIEGADGLYNVTGHITEQDGVKGFGSNTSKFYFAYTITLDDGIDTSKAKVKIPKKANPETNDYNIANFTDGKSITVLMEVEESEVGESAANGYRDIIVDIDGVPTKIRIDFSKLELRKNSKFAVEDAKNENKLNEEYGWTKPSDYDVTYTTEGDTIKVTGLLPIFDGVSENLPFKGECETDYYIAFAIKTNHNKETATTVKITDGTETISWGESNFDTTDTIYMLKHLHPDAKSKTFTIEVDMDGEGTKYESELITVDWSGLKLQNVSLDDVDCDVANEAEISADKDLLAWQFNADTVKGITVKTDGASQPDRDPSKVGLEGTIKEQTIGEGAGFGENKGYFLPIKISFPKKDYLQEYSHKWTITLYGEDEQKKEPYTPTEDEYKQGWVMVLFKLKDEGGTLKYEIDFDGNEIAFLPTEYKIDYTGLSFAEAHQITFEGVKTDPITVYTGDKLTEDMLPKTVETDDSYHEFVYWNKEDGTKFDAIQFANEKDVDADGKETGDVKLVPHWNLYSDKFISDVLEDLNKTEDTQSGNFSDEFVIEDYEENSGKVTITVKDPTVKLSRMNETSIPGTIAYILLKDEIQSVTLEVNGQSKEFTKDLGTEQSALKQAIQNGAKELYTGILSSNFEGKDDNTVTLSDLAHKEGCNSFTLKLDPEKVAKTVTLTKAPDEGELSLASVVDVPTEYEFTFKSDTVIVKSQDELTTALKGNAEHILIGGSFGVTSTVNIERSIVIGGNSEYTITAGSDVDNIFNVKAKNVTIDTIKLKDAKTPIVVTTGGSLTSTGLTVEGENVESAVEVKNGATLNISELTYENEHYTKPAVKAEKESATVTFTDSEDKRATKLETIEKITKYEEIKELPKGYGDKKETIDDYNYYNYYNDAEHSKIYKTTFHNHEGRELATFERYNYSGENVTEPDKTDFDVFKSFNYNAETYTLIGYAESRDNTVNFEYSGDLPKGVVAPESIKATADKYYYAAYKVTPKEGTKKVTDAQGLREAINDERYSEIYIDTTSEIDLSAYDITISRKLSIVGPSRKVKIKVKGIKVTADNVFLHRLDLEVDAQEGAQALIDITDSASKFTLWQCSLKNTSQTQKVDNAIKYSGTEKATVDVRWNTIYADNIKNTLLNIDSGLAAVTDIYGNTFKKLNTEDGSKKSAITIKTFDESATMKDDDETIRIAANTFDSENYAIEISTEASSNEADISLEISKDIEIAVKYDENHKQFGNIKLHHSEDPNKIKITYIDGEGHTSSTLQDGEGIEVAVPKGMQSVPEQAVIKGLKLNGDTYSGVISQSEDGKFYLPVALTSNDFEDRVSTVKVTDPNGNVKTYLYGSNSKDGIATVSNAKTMNLQLEAIKSSKITGNNGKVYKLELDADGDKSNDYEVKEYTINYSDVETLEEKINQAAKNTLEANSFTVTKNNKINGYTEEFTYKYNANDGLTHLKANKDNVEEYTFSVKYAGVADGTSKLSVVARKRKENEGDSGVYLNDWVYVHPQQVGRAIHEVTMLTDVMKDSKTSINAIDTVELVEGKEHNYTVKLNGNKYTDWVKNNYRLTSKYTVTEWGETVLVDVELDENDKYIKSIKTHQESSSNTFDVTFENVNATTIKEPKEFFAEEGKTLTENDIKEFYESGKKWWDKYIHENAYKQQ